jgi:group I intron endonuclease
MVIYKITNLINNKIYIGQTVCSIESRWKNHLSKNSCCRFLKNAIVKYWADNFKIEEIDGANSRDELNYKEWLWIYKLNSMVPNGYNLISGGKSRIPSMETRIKRSNSMKGKNTYRRNPEQAKLLREYQLGKKHSQETIDKRRVKLEVKIVECSTGIVYESIRKAANALGLNPANISANLAQKTAFCGGRIFKYEKNWDGVLVPEIKQEDFKKSKPVIHVNTGKIYKNTKEASLDTGLNHGSIRQSVSGKKAFKTHIFQYTNL